MKAKFVLFIYVIIWYGQQANAQQLINEVKKIIIIDPGHGGLDSGATSEKGIIEKDVVLDIARNMVAWNNRIWKNKYDIYLTRNNDTLISLDDRAKLAKHMKPDVFISLHCNHNGDSRIKGLEIYTYKTNSQSFLYAQIILKNLNEKLGFRTREVKQANFQVLRETSNSCPAILLELGYLSNKDESDYMINKEKRKALALAILMAI